MTDSKTWRRRERAMFAGVLLWTLAVGGFAALAPELLARWLLRTDPLLIVGSMLITIGALGGAANAAIVLLAGLGSTADSDLTDWDGGPQ